jgi:hypothetical protein
VVLGQLIAFRKREAYREKSQNKSGRKTKQDISK